MKIDPLHGAEMMLFTERLLFSILSFPTSCMISWKHLNYIYNTSDACLGGEVFTMAIRNKYNMQIFSKSDFKIMARISVT